MKKIAAVIVGTALLMNLFACSNQTSSSASGTASGSGSSTVTGQVTTISGNSYTLKLGTITGSKSTDGSGGAPAGNAPSGGKPTGNAPTGSAPSGDKPNGNAPAGSAPSGDKQTGNPPTGSAPSGNKPDGNPPAGGPGNGGGNFKTFTAGSESLTITINDSTSVTIEGKDNNVTGKASSIKVGDVLEVQLGENHTATAVTVKNLSGGGFGGSSQVTNGTSANTIKESATITGTTYTSSGDDENALRIDGVTATLKNITVNKSGGKTSNTENGDFYGQNAGLLALNGANVTISGANVTTNAQNGNGVFSYGKGTTVTISDSKITTSKDNSGGIQTTGGGTTNAKNLTVSTSGNSSAAIRSDRGGGTVVVDGGTYKTFGTGSPAIYSTAAISVSNATLSAANSEALVIEGLNSISLKNCSLTGNMTATKTNDGSENLHNIMLYQSMSGDAQVGTSKLSVSGGSITAKSGDMFYVTNTSSVITLDSVTLNLANENLLTVAGNSSSRGWGTAGKNGGQLTFSATNMNLTGKVTVDTISTLNFTLGEGSSLKGTINIVKNAAGGTAVSNNAVVMVAKGATWNLTGNCSVTSLTNNGTIHYNGYTITLADGTVLKS